MLKKLTLVFSICLSGVGVSFAQSDEAPPRYIRFLPLGDPPPWIEKRVNGVRKQQAAKPGSVPPATVTIGALKGESKKLGLTLRTATPYRQLDETQPNANIMVGDGSAKPWVKLRMPTAPVSVGILLRNPAAKPATWDRAGIKVLKEDLQSFPLKTLRFVNMTLSDASIQLGDAKKHIVKKGQVKVIPLPSLEFSLTIKAAGNNRTVETLYQNEFIALQGERVSAIAYLADGEFRDQKNRIHLFSEPFKLPRPIKTSKLK